MKYIALFLALPGLATAEPVRLSAAEIRSLLVGNTAIGTWVDHDYRQYFPNLGTTYYAPKNGRSSRGRWRVNDATDEYESEWNESGYWEGYGVTTENGRYFWISEGVAPQPFSILTGDHLVWPSD